MVREFYANGMNLPKTEDIERYTSYVRGKVVRFDKEAIAQVLSIPDETDEGFRCYFYHMLEGRYIKDDILATVSDGNDSWKMGTDRRPKSLKRRFLKPMAMELLNVILANIQPSMHCSEVTLERVFLLYVMLKGHDLDLARVLATEIHRSIITNRAITHPSLIHKLCVHAGVPDEIEEELKPGEILGSKMLNRKKARLISERDSDEEVFEQEGVRQGVSTSSSSQGYGQRILSTLERMESKMEGLERRLTRIEKIQRFLKKQGAALKKLFGLKKKNREPSDPKGKRAMTAEDEDAEADLDSGSDEDESDMDQVMADAFDDDGDDDDDGGDDLDDIVAAAAFDDPYGDDSPV